MLELSIAVIIIVGVTEAVKRTGRLTSQWSAVFAIVLGVVIMTFSGGDATWTDKILEGIVAGLTAAGLYSGTKAVSGK